MLNKELFYNTIKDYKINIDDEAYSRLDRYAEILVETNKQFNLTAITEPDDITVKHFADCLAIFNYADFQSGAKIIDVGTGAGFPGLVMLLCRPDLNVTFLDGTGKKLVFIEKVMESVGVTGNILHRRAEDAGQDINFREQFDFATARAVANLSALSEYCLPFVKEGGLFISMKSASSDNEITDAQNAIKTLGGEMLDNKMFDLVENTPRRIILIKKISQTPSKYPRASSKISKNPLK